MLMFELFGGFDAPIAQTKARSVAILRDALFSSDRDVYQQF